MTIAILQCNITTTIAILQCNITTTIAILQWNIAATGIQSADKLLIYGCFRLINLGNRYKWENVKLPHIVQLFS